MSGSPIIQDGKLVGAVTHVLVNDPTTGYGIFIENMLDAAGKKRGTVKHHYGSGGSPEAEKAQQCKRPKGRRNNAVVERTG